MFQIFAYIFGGIAAALVGVVIGLGIYTGITNKKNNALEARVREQDITIRNRDRLINEFKAKLSFLEKVVAEHKKNRGRNKDRIRELKKQTTDLIAARVIDNDKIGELSNKYADLEQKIAQETAAGNGVSILTASERMEKFYYSVAILNSVLRQNLKNLFPDIQEHDSTMISNGSASQPFAILPAVISNFIKYDNAVIKQKIASVIEELTSNNSKIGKILIPYLDNDKQHWVLVEMHVQKNKDQLIVSATLHDPRGGGELNQEQKHCFEEILQGIAGNNLLTFETYPSHYSTVRQSLPDRISCGPIIVNEILLLAQNKTLDRSIPYGFGATEIIQEQCLTDNNDTKRLKANRYKFLHNLQSPNLGHHYSQENSGICQPTQGGR